jgi:hypothetical protein
MTIHKVKVSVLLEPVGTPDVVVICNDQRHELIVVEPLWIDFLYDKEQGPSSITVEHRNRQDNVTAVIIKAVKLNDLEHIQNIYQGIYYPNGMEPKRDNYVAWEGIWVLDFTVPVYTWMHQTQGLGWIYD